MSAIPLSPLQMSALRRAHEQAGIYRAGVVPARTLGVGPSTLAALVRRGYLDLRNFPHAGYKLTARAEKLFVDPTPKVVDRQSPDYLAGERAANVVLDLGGAAFAATLIAGGEKGSEVAHNEDAARYHYLRGFVTTLREFTSDQGAETC